MNVFDTLKTLNLNVDSILDIGANIGEFSKQISLIYPQAYILMIEANELCEPLLKSLKKDYIITALSDSSKEIDFYVNPSDPLCTGNSYYKENSLAFKDPVIKKMNTKRLDDIVQINFDLIKIDTQGSELDIMMGGIETLSKAKYVLLECSTIKERVYNQGAPHSDEIFKFMFDNKFQKHYLVEEHIWNSSFDTISYKTGEVFQRDYLFVKEI